MNSLPFISHHLFVAAIGNDGRGTARPIRHERPSAGPAEPANAIASEVMDDRKPWLAGTTRPVRASVAQARS
ncbi:MAG: hypothetical protein ACLQU3_11970 [Limisphaerales bacterium]